MKRGVTVTTLVVVAACSGPGAPDDGAPPRTPTAQPSTAQPSTAQPSTPQSSTAQPTPTQAVFPGSSWRRAEQGDWSALDADLAANGSTCVAVIKDGRLVHDGYWNGGAPRAQQRVYSIAKSLTSLLVGTAVDDGALDLDASASEQVDQWRGTDAEAITVRDLLSMTSGRQWSDAADRRMIRATSDQTAFSVALPQEGPPGERWVYDNAAVQTLESVLDDAGPTTSSISHRSACSALSGCATRRGAATPGAMR